MYQLDNQSLICLYCQMYGEKVEEADELRMDLEDVKEMYKAQVKPFQLQEHFTLRLCSVRKENIFVLFQIEQLLKKS